MDSRPGLTRREVLRVGAGFGAASLLGLAACGGDDDAGDSATTDSTAGRDPSYALAPFVGGPVFLPGVENRLPLGVRDADGLLHAASAPAALEVVVLDGAGEPVGDPMTVDRHAEGLPRPYYPLRFTVPKAGEYTARATIAGSVAVTPIQVLAPDAVTVVQPGEKLPRVATPTVDRPRGVNPICTRSPVCPLHDVSLDTALANGEPVALLVSTPAFCQVAICGPVLDILLDEVGRFPSLRFLHAEVYEDPAKSLEKTAPVVGALHLPYEPVLVVARADGTIVERVDTIFDRTELRAALASVTD